MEASNLGVATSALHDSNDLVISEERSSQRPLKKEGTEKLRLEKFVQEKKED